ncbi:MAG: protocatechuate 3,4-dioxygenase subunit beta [Paracoccaceae bacterium]
MTGKTQTLANAHAAAYHRSRRNLLTGITAGAALLASGRAATAVCALTPGQVDGPFYPVAIQDQDWDLTRVSGGTGRAQGEVIEVTGQVLDPDCRPLPGCVIEIWQANVHGRYNHPRDEGKGRPLDPNFQGFARIPVDKDGRYRFLTIIPGSYAAMGEWIRPPHIHFKVHAPFNPSVTTQMYFAGHPLNAKDLLLAPLSPAQRASLEVGFDTVRADGVRSGAFNIALGAGWMPPEGVVVPGGG